MIRQERTDRSDAHGFVHALLEPEIKCWRGEQPLWKVFWGYGVLANSSVGLLFALSLYGGYIGLQQMLLLCVAGYTFWLLVSLWRSSKNTGNPFWGTLARQLVVVWAGNTIMVLIFLQFDLVERYLGVFSTMMAP